MTRAPLVGRDAIRDFVARHATRQAPTIDIRTCVVCGNIVVTERTERLVVNEREVALQICGVLEVDNGRITAWRDYFDTGPLREAGQQRAAPG
jgi:limonene-1,2-epoxide hydrolase